MAKAPAAIVLALCVLAAACSGDGDNSPTPSEAPATSDASAVDPTEFQSEIGALCGRLLQADDAVNKAATEEEFDDATAALAEEQERFVEEAERLTPPPEVEKPFSTYLEKIHQIM